MHEIIKHIIILLKYHLIPCNFTIRYLRMCTLVASSIEMSDTVASEDECHTMQQLSATVLRLIFANCDDLNTANIDRFEVDLTRRTV